MNRQNHWEAAGVISTLAVAPTGIGDLMVVGRASGESVGTQNFLTDLQGGGVANWQRIVVAIHQLTNDANAELWWGTVSSTGAATITAVEPNGVNELVCDEFSSAWGASTVWRAEVSGSLVNPSSANVPFPSLTAPSQRADLVYSGYGYCNSVGVAGSSAPLTWVKTVGNDLSLYGFPLSPQAYAPVASQAPADISNVVAAIFSAAPAPGRNGSSRIGSRGAGW